MNDRGGVPSQQAGGRMCKSTRLNTPDNGARPLAAVALWECRGGSSRSVSPFQSTYDNDQWKHRHRDCATVAD